MFKALASTETRKNTHAGFTNADTDFSINHVCRALFERCTLKRLFLYKSGRDVKNIFSVIILSCLFIFGTHYVLTAKPVNQTLELNKFFDKSGNSQDEHFSGPVVMKSFFASNWLAKLDSTTYQLAPGTRSRWHTHSVGQIVIVTAGEGLVQQWGKEVQKIKVGDVVWMPANVKHWHGAAALNGVTDLTIEAGLEMKSTWLEPVADEEYHSKNKAN